MATLNLGRIKPVFRGAYSGSTAYVVDDIVTHGNESFICIQAHGAGTQATSVTAYWTKLAAKGTDGTDVGTTITTQGDILFRDGSGLQRLAKGTASQTLKMNSGATAPEWVTVTPPTSDFVKLARVTLGSSASTLMIDNYFTADYQNYKLFWKFRSTGNNNTLEARIVTGGNGTVSSGSYYRGFHGGGEVTSGQTNNTQSHRRWDNDSWQFTGAGDSWYGATSHMWTHMGEMNFVDPLSTTKRASMFGISHFIGSSDRMMTNYFSGYFNADQSIATTGIQFIEGSDNIESGSYVDIYGIK